MSLAIIGGQDDVCAGLLHRHRAVPTPVGEASGIGWEDAYRRLRLDDVT